MKAITLHQPWASLIAYGYKMIETRTHARFSGLVGERIAIHAGLTYDRGASERIAKANVYARRHSGLLGLLADWLWEELDNGTDKSASATRCGGKIWPRGVIVAKATVIETRWLTIEDTTKAMCDAQGLFGLVLHNVAKVVPAIPHAGHQGIWEWREESTAVGKDTT